MSMGYKKDIFAVLRMNLNSRIKSKLAKKPYFMLLSSSRIWTVDSDFNCVFIFITPINLGIDYLVLDPFCITFGY